MSDILELVPYSPNLILKNISFSLRIFELIKHLLENSIHAVTNFSNGNYRSFDALIGENSCQIRAYYIFLLASRQFPNFDLHSFLKYKNEILRIQKIIYFKIKLFSKMKDKPTAIIKTFFNSDETLIDFFNREKCDISIPPILIFLIQNFFLSRYTLRNHKGIHTGINYAKMCLDLHCSKTTARKLVHYYQVNISMMSCNFMLTLLNDLPLFPLHTLIVKNLILKDDDGRSVMPIYITMKIILSHLEKHSFQVLLKVNVGFLEDEFISKIVTKKINYRMQNDKFFPKIIFRGESLFKNSSKNDFLAFNKSLEIIGFSNILLANMASHPQYPGKNLSCYKENPFEILIKSNISSNEKNCIKILENEFLYMKHFALTGGCNAENPTLFFTTHIFCDNYFNDHLEEAKVVHASQEFGLNFEVELPVLT